MSRARWYQERRERTQTGRRHVSRSQQPHAILIEPRESAAGEAEREYLAHTAAQTQMVLGICTAGRSGIDVHRGYATTTPGELEFSQKTVGCFQAS